MSLTHVGTLTLGAAMPIALVASANLEAATALVFPSLSAQLQGLIQLQAALSIQAPSIAGNLKTAISLVAILEESLAVGVPGIDFQVAAVASLLAKVQADLASVSVVVDFGASFAAVLGAAGIDLYVYAGRVQDMGAELARNLEAGLPGGAAPTDACTAVVLAASSPAAVAALGTLFRKAS